MPQKYVRLASLLFNCIIVNVAETVKLMDTNLRLPVPIANHASVYDGADSIYIIGGYSDSESGTYQDKVIKYSLEMSQVQQVGTFVGVAFGESVMHEDDILYFGGHGDLEPSSAIYQYSTLTNTHSILCHLPRPMQNMALAWDSNQQIAHIFGGYLYNSQIALNQILLFNASSNEIDQVSELPTVRHGASGIWDKDRGVAHVLGGLPNSTVDILQYEPINKTLTESSALLPSEVAYSCAILANGQIYLIGGNSENSQGPIKYNPNTNNAVTLQIDGWPTSLNYASCVYANDKVYVLGGYGSLRGEPSKFRNEIWYFDLRESDDDISKSKIGFYVIVTIVPLIVVSIIGIFFFYIWRHMRRRKDSRHPAVVNSDSGEDNGGAGLTLAEIQEFEQGSQLNEVNERIYIYQTSTNIPCQPYDRAYELGESEVFIDRSKALGSGEFGIVHLGTHKATGAPLALKTVKRHCQDKFYVMALLSELKILTYLGSHKHIVNLVGAQTSELNKGIVYLFLEFCPLGDLENYLRQHKHSFLNCEESEENSQPCTNVDVTNLQQTGAPYLHPCEISSICICDLFHWTIQTSSAMVYLSSKKVIHGDLATRNILLLNKSCSKITDFGLSRKLYNYTNYKKTQETPLPWRSLAIESLLEMTFSTQSDVWSFGVTMWEIFSLAEIPYTMGTQVSIEFITKLKEGLRLQKPKLVQTSLYNEMLECWNLQPNDRPTFAQLYERLQKLQQKSNCHNRTKSLAQ